MIDVFQKKPNQLKRQNHQTDKLNRNEKKTSDLLLKEPKPKSTKKSKQLDDKEIRLSNQKFFKKIQPTVKPSEDQELNISRKDKGCSIGEIEKLIQSNEPTDEAASNANQLDKRQRMELFKKRLHQKTPATNLVEAFELINATLIEIEDEYGPKIEDTQFFNSKKYGKMHPLAKEKIKLNSETGKHEMVTVGFMIVLRENGGFEFWTKCPVEPTKIFSKNGLSIKNINNSIK